MASDGIEIKELISGYTWSVAPTGRTVIKYSFLDALPSIYQGLPADKGYTNFNALNPQERNVIRGIFEYLETILNIDFQDVTGTETGAITFGWVDGPAP